MMEAYHELMARVLERLKLGKWSTNRTGVRTLMTPGAQVQYDLSTGRFPAITTKKLAFKQMKGELIGFFRGYDNAAQFRAVGCNIWDANANETPAWLNSKYRRGHDDLGRIYSRQWTDWSVYEPAGQDENGETLYRRKSLNQLEAALRTILTNPDDRRIIISGWRPEEFDQMALPPCHVIYHFIPEQQDRVMHLTMWMRSNDLFLGHSFNCSEAALFLEIMCRLANYKPGLVTIQISNAHIYESHVRSVEEQLTREHYDAPKLVLSDRIKPVTLEEIPGVFTRIEPDDIWLEGYQSHPPLKAPMAV